MTINDYADAINAQIDLTRYANQGNRWTAKFYGCEISDCGCLVGEYGNADSPTASIADYVAKIRNKKIVFHAMSDSRREFVVPDSLTAE